MHYWILKSEPETYSWHDLERDHTTAWTGVRNFQARNNLRAMAIGDLCLFYHSGKERQIIGIASVTKAPYPDPTSTDPNWLAVDITAQSKLPTPVTLETIKAVASLAHIALVKHSRLSVGPIDKAAYQLICNLAA
ncbi:EVE domain-containing protein [Candidatus Gracilibacteria bacterium]|nr:EVE domain-containing protein [Candidatus Gracilibacteria bacterium]